LERNKLLHPAAATLCYGRGSKEVFMTEKEILIEKLLDQSELDLSCCSGHCSGGGGGPKAD
jgi:hypothetical protein